MRATARPASERPVRRQAGPGVAGLALALLAGGGLLSGCGGSGSISASADFTDVSTLVAGAPVEMNDIRIGSVTSITLQGDEARVAMSIERSARVPADVTADVETTTILGEEIIELTPGPGVTSSSPLLADGARISHAVVVPELEQLVKGGADLFSQISASALGSLVEAGGQGFGDQGAQIHRLLDDLSSVSAGYATQTAQIRSLIDSLDQLGASTAPDAEADAQAVTNLARTTQILAAQSTRFENLLSALDGLSVQGRSILQRYLSQIGIQLTGLADTVQTVAAQQKSLAEIIVELKDNDATLSQATVGRLVQVLDDIIVCGVPDGGSNSSATATCGPSAGTSSPVSEGSHDATGAGKVAGP